MTLPVLDWAPRFDERSRNFPVRGIIKQNNLRSYTWSCKPHLDQGQEGACVGYGFAHDIAARPDVSPADNALAERIYHQAQREDDDPGENYEGTSVLAGAKVVTELNYYTSYRWAFGVDDVLMALSWVGPVVIGIYWYNDMEDTDRRGYLHPTGGIAGGHCTLLKSYSQANNRVTVHNSWGTSWGKKGDAYLSVADLGKLLNNDGEACIPTRKVAR